MLLGKTLTEWQAQEQRREAVAYRGSYAPPARRPKNVCARCSLAGDATTTSLCPFDVGTFPQRSELAAQATGQTVHLLLILPGGQANLAPTTLLATTLAGKIHEGWDRITKGHPHEALEDVHIFGRLKPLQGELAAALAQRLLLGFGTTSRSTIPIVYWRLKKLTQHLEDLDATILLAPERLRLATLLRSISETHRGH